MISLIDWNCQFALPQLIFMLIRVATGLITNWSEWQSNKEKYLKLYSDAYRLLMQGNMNLMNTLQIQLGDPAIHSTLHFIGFAFEYILFEGRYLQLLELSYPYLEFIHKILHWRPYDFRWQQYNKYLCTRLSRELIVLTV